MKDITNSQRRLYKATYAPTKLPEDGRDASSQQAQMRAFEKLSFVQSLAIRPSELNRVRKALARDSGGPPVRELLEAVDIIEKVVKDPSPGSSISYAANFALIRAEVLLQLAKLLADKRLALTRLVVSSLERIRMRYAAARRDAIRVAVPPVAATESTDSVRQLGTRPPSPVAAGSESPQTDTTTVPAVSSVESGAREGTTAPLPEDRQRDSLSAATEIGSARLTSQQSMKVTAPVVPGAAISQETNASAQMREAAGQEAPAPSGVGPALAESGDENEVTGPIILEPPPLEEAIKWAAVHEENRIRPLQSLAISLAPVSPLYSNAGPVALVTNLLLRLKDIHAWTKGMILAFEQRMKIEPVGRLHLERMDMTPVGVERGELLYSVPLTPKETVNISHKEWSTKTEEFEKIVQDYFEGYSEEGVAEKDDASMSTESQSRHSTALNVGASLSASYSSVTLSSSFGFNANSDDQQAQKESRNHSVALTRKASSRTRKDHKVTFKVSSVAGTEDMAVRVITNPSDTKTMRVDYFRLMRKWRVQLYRYGLRMTYDIIVPNPGADLIRKMEDLRALDALLNLPFSFDLDPTQIDRTNWVVLAAKYNANVEQPPVDTRWLHIAKVLPLKSKDDSQTTEFALLDFEVDADYEVGWGTVLRGFVLPWITSPDFEILSDQPSYRNNVTVNNSVLLLVEYPLQAWQGKNGKLSVTYRMRWIQSGEIHAWIELKLTAAAFERWQVKAWNTMRQAAEEAYFQNRQTLKERRAQLLEEIGNMDALTLRRMEREEIMKGVLRWLFGPTFELVPSDIQAMFTQIDPQDPLSTDILDPNLLSNQSWERVMEVGEFIKYLHQAIEWENVLAFMYPYFWDSPKNWDRKRFLNHPDSFHRDFLRAGCARVVLTIRPGFEESFAALIETGAFGQLPGNHPYVTIAQEIQNYANTNYPGIPSANPPPGVSDEQLDDETREAERGKLIARWYEYTPTSALDIAVDTVMTDLA